jgi:invasion protein IalB
MFRFLSLVAVGYLTCSNFAIAQVPRRTAATYDDWTITCIYTADTKQRSCELSQAQVLRDQQSPSSRITVEPSSNDSFKLNFQIAANVHIAEGVRLLGNDQEPIAIAAIQWCGPAYCVAETRTNSDALKKLNDQDSSGRLVYKNASQKDMIIPVSFKGFSQAAKLMQTQEAPVVEASAQVARFDGQWSTEAECRAISPNVAKTNWKTITRIENGKLSAKFGDDGKPGSGKFEGVVSADGHIELSVNGLTGDSKYNLNNVPEKTPYTWKAAGSFSGLHGTAKRSEGRFCVVSFSKSN